MAQLLIRRGTQPAIDAVLDQLSDHEFGEQALQLVRAELDTGRSSAAPCTTERISSCQKYIETPGKVVGKARGPRRFLT